VLVVSGFVGLNWLLRLSSEVKVGNQRSPGVSLGLGTSATVVEQQRVDVRPREGQTTKLSKN
jgi:hypothetical protein